MPACYFRFTRRIGGSPEPVCGVVQRGRNVHRRTWPRATPWAAIGCAALTFASTTSQSAAASNVSQWLDAAPFARVCVSDPQRLVGVRAGRVQEIAAEDLRLETEMRPEADGMWHVPRAGDGRAAIGLQWNEHRPIRWLAIEFGPGFELPAGASLRVEAWVGATLWQGEWKPLGGQLQVEGNGWSYTPEKVGVLCQKVRWILPAGEGPVPVRRFTALTTSAMVTSELRILRDPRPASGEAWIEGYNAEWTEGGRRVVRQSWDQRQPITLSVRHVSAAGSQEVRGDRSLLRLRMPEGAVTVGIDDVLERGPVFVAHLGLFVVRAGEPFDPVAHRRGLEGKRTILEEVRALPDQTRERAMRVTHYNARLDRGSLMLSLAANNAKFVTDADGVVRCYDSFTRDEEVRSPRCELVPFFGQGRVLARSQGWGRLGIDCAAHADPANALRLRIKEREYRRGLGHHAPGEIVLDVSEGFDRFEAEVGLQWQGGETPGSVEFEVLVDGQKVFGSGVMRETDAPKTVSVPLVRGRTLTLRLGDAGDGLGYDAANWAEARLIRGGTTEHVSDWVLRRPTTARHLEGGWLPAPVITMAAEGVEYRQRTYVIPLAPESGGDVPWWLNAKSLGVIELTAENRTAGPVEARASYALTAGAGTNREVTFRIDGPRVTAVGEVGVLAVFDGTGNPESSWRAEGGRVHLTSRLPAGASGRCFVYVPAWPVEAGASAELRGGEAGFQTLRDYWDRVLEPGVQFELPDRWLADVIRANQVHMLMAARNEEQGRLVAPWIAADRYLFALDSEGNSVIRGLQYLGQFDFAQRAIAYHFSKYRPEGFMTTGYTLMGNGWHLWALSEYLRLSAADDWFGSVAEKSAGLCRWVMAQLEKTRRLGAGREPVPEYGLMPPGVQADWEAYACYFYANSYFWAGLEGTGAALRRIGHPDADRALSAARQLRVDLLRAFRRVQALAPVVPLRNGTWVPYYPGSVYTPGPMADYYPGQDGNRSWAYDVDLGSHHLIALGAMPPDAPEVDWIMNHMEDVQFLADGWGGYPAARNREAWFDMGGFAKVQPYYARNAEVYALRDDVKPFLRSYFNTLASLIDGTALSIFEHFSNFCYNKTHETGYFLHQSRTMLLTERGEDLWLAPFVPTAWLENGKEIVVTRAPTFFGATSYRVRSSVADGHIEARIEPPARAQPRAIVLRLRHPEGKPIRSVTVNGGRHTAFDVRRETITLPSGEGTLNVRAEY